ncbi:MAG: aminodeoxychorismate synthase component I [Bacteroidota bacterium]
MPSVLVNIISRDEIISKINHLAIAAKPFLFAVDFEGDHGFVLTPGEAENHGILYDFEGITNGKIQPAIHPRKFEISPVSFPTYRKAFDHVIHHLHRGDTYLINLTFPTPIVTDRTPEELFFASHAPFKLYVPGQFVVFSPEIFVRIQGHTISSFPMKGTIDAATPDAGKRLMENEKEFFEHNTIVDLIRNDLSMVSTNVTVKRFRYLELIKTNRDDLWQMSSAINGKLPDCYLKNLGEILFTLLPVGSVTGAPKEKTVQIIRETETYQRGFYTGIFGYFNGHSLSSAVLIRYVELNKENIRIIRFETEDGRNPIPDFTNEYPVMVFKSGGGITALSDAESEYREMIQKVYVPLV